MKKIKKLTKKQWVLFVAILAAIALGSAGFYLTGGTEVVLANAELRDVVEIVEEAGQVESRSAVTVVSKGSGVVGEILVQEGETVQAGDLILSFSDFAPTAEVAGIRAQAQGVYAQYIAAKALSDNNRILYEEGAVSQLEYTQSLAVTRQLAAQLASLGYSADSLSSATGADGVVSPLSGVVTAVYVREEETWVYVAAGGNAVQTRVTIGLEGVEYVEIIDGLSPGDRILASPPSDLVDGMRIKEK